jgi:L-threonylcarbamoyladenylate synthase
MIWENEELSNTLQRGGVVVMPTDTIYGIVGQALNESTVERIYEIRKRTPSKPCIILISKIEELKKFSINLSEKQKIELEKYWPGPVSIILDCFDDKFKYLHRGTNTLAFRIPHLQALRELLLKVGPLVAPSANTEALPPSQSIAEAKKYFGDKVDLYVDGGSLIAKASQVIKLAKNGFVTVLRA